MTKECEVIYLVIKVNNFKAKRLCLRILYNLVKDRI